MLIILTNAKPFGRNNRRITKSILREHGLLGQKELIYL